MAGVVPSNKSGWPIFLIDAELLSIYFMNEGIRTFDLSVFETDGITSTLIDTLSVVSKRIDSINLSVPKALTTGKALQMQITSGSTKNIVAGVLIGGTRV
ncbi:MAG: hypothetical protein IIC67_11865 [Thaumarchaeota archaeon]|nr:hypothetical protein [Nitrososphaerota archaeon]